MLSIGKIGKSEAQQKYYEETVAKSREDYYAGSGEAPGEFFGAGARTLGLSGESNMDHLMRLFAGQNPATGEQLRSMKGNVQVHGLDMTFSAPKSVSVAYALGDESLRANIVEAHEWANGQAIAYMERESARVVRGHKATKSERLAGIEDTLTTHRAGGFVGIRYRHRLNRLLDPQLHTHYVIGNWAIGPDGRATALAAEHIYDHAKSGGAVYQLALRSKLRELEPWVEWGEVENGLSEFSPELMDPDLLREFSMRTRDIEEFIANPAKFIRNPARAREAEMAMAGMGDRARRQYATLRTRKSKIEGQFDEESWNADVVARAGEWLTREDLAAYREMPAFENTQPFDVAAVQAHAFGPNGVTANQNTFERKDVVIEVANAARQGVGPWLSDIDAAVGEVMTSDQVMYVRTDKLREKNTTVELYNRERHMVEVAVDGLAIDRAIVGEDAIEQGLKEFYATHANIESLLPQQENVLRAVVTDGNAISSIEALAGSGKTTTAGAMRDVFEAGGYRAFAAGPTGRAVRELAGAGFDRPRTLSAWEVKFEYMGEHEAIRRAFGDPSRAVLFIDDRHG
jgi:conjugative relaxase-like TrwC/TraI family protein